MRATRIRPEDPSLPSSKHGNYPPAYPIPPVKNSIDPKIAARVGAIGPAPNPANNKYLALESYKYLVPNTEATLPTGFCAACTPHDRRSAEHLELAAHWPSSSMGLGGAIVSPHSQSTSQVFHMVRILKEKGKLHLLKGIIIPEGGRHDLRRRRSHAVGLRHGSVPDRQRRLSCR